MFTGIIESLATIIGKTQDGSNIHFEISCDFLEELSIDQSVAHNGVCLTVVSLSDKSYVVTAIEETLNVTSAKHWSVGDRLNLERCMKLGARLDGHIVQGHVDTMAICIDEKERDGSWEFSFEYEKKPNHITVPKGSITVNGTSLTVVNSEANRFSVAIIPYTYEHTVFQYISKGSQVNLEFDVIGKYVARLMEGVK
ncbi:MAG: riboflavin synthase [Flavobacteriales bacterium]|jgi:riboflavin synthase